MLLGVVAVHVHLSHIGMGQAAQFQVHDDQAAQLAVEEQQVHSIPGLIDAQPTLPTYEGKSFSQLQQEVLQPPDQRRFQIRLRILVLEVEELQHIRVLDRVAGHDDILGPGHGCLGQHCCLVLGQGRAFVELTSDLTVELAHAPATAQRLDLVEMPGMVILDRQQSNIGRPRKCENLGQFGEVEFPRRCLGFFCARSFPGFPRRCLGNRGRGVCEEETPHVLQVVRAEPTPEAGSQIGG